MSMVILGTRWTDSPMGTQYFDGKLGHGVSCEEGQVGRWAGGQVQYTVHRATT